MLHALPPTSSPQPQLKRARVAATSTRSPSPQAAKAATGAARTTTANAVHTETMCRYRNKLCLNPRAIKRNGELHNLCEKHRAKANQNQRKLESKRRMQKRLTHVPGVSHASAAHPVVLPGVNALPYGYVSETVGASFTPSTLPRSSAHTLPSLPQLRRQHHDRPEWN
ncbi:hypothetical protein PINS_up006025 [Pythium insidiosum]|nr:hypothetical protein PINS_up006025 [Pythium insidiosum]